MLVYNFNKKTIGGVRKGILPKHFIAPKNCRYSNTTNQASPKKIELKEKTILMFSSHLIVGKFSITTKCIFLIRWISPEMISSHLIQGGAGVHTRSEICQTEASSRLIQVCIITAHWLTVRALEKIKYISQDHINTSNSWDRSFSHPYSWVIQGV